MNEHSLIARYQAERVITRLATNPEEAREVVRLLGQSNWEQIFEGDTCTCVKCGSCVQFHKMNFPTRTCLVCYEQPKPYRCKQCDAHFMLPWNISFWSRSGLCPTCRTLPCVLCGTVQTWDNTQLPLICEQCYIVNHINIRKEIHKLKVHMDRARVNGLPATLTFEQWFSRLVETHFLCQYCLTSPYEHADHFIPLCKGGGTVLDNMVPACESCNKLKGQRHPDKVTSIPREALNRVRSYLEQFS